MHHSKFVLKISLCILSLFLLCGCGKTSQSTGVSHGGGRPATSESMLEASVEALFFDKNLSVANLKQYAPEFSGSGAAQSYWQEMESALDDLKEYGLEFTGYSISNTRVYESDSMQTYGFGYPFVDYTVDTAVIYTVRLDAKYNPDLAENDEFRAELQAAMPNLVSEDQISESFYIDVEISSRDGVWYFATDESGIEDWAVRFSYD